MTAVAFAGSFLPFNLLTSTVGQGKCFKVQLDITETQH